MAKEIFERNIQKEEHSEPRLDLGILKRKSNAKTPSGLVLSYAKKSREKGDLEMALLLQEIYKKVRDIEISEKVRLESWKGKSGIKVIVMPDKFIIIRHQKIEKGEKPKEIRSEVSRQEVNKVIWAINELAKTFDKIPTSKIAEKVYRKKWGNVFSTRPEHITLTHILNILEYYGIIHYFRSGYTTILKEIRNIQVVLK